MTNQLGMLRYWQIFQKIFPEFFNPAYLLQLWIFKVFIKDTDVAPQTLRGGGYPGGRVTPRYGGGGT